MLRVLLFALVFWLPRSAEAGSVPPSYKAQTKRAQEALRRGDWEMAEATARTAQEVAPTEYLAYPLRAIALSMQGRGEEAEAEIKTAIRMRPQSSGLRGVHALVLNRAGRFKEAEQAVERSIEGRPTSSWSWYQLAYSQAGRGDRKGCLRSLEQASVLKPERYGERHERARKTPDAPNLLVSFRADPAIEDCWFVRSLQRTVLERKIRRMRRSFPWIPMIGITLFLFLVLFLLRGRIADWLVRWGTAHGGTPTPTDMGTPIVGFPGSRGGPSPKTPPRLPAGYRIIRQIGSGGMGAVFEAEDLSLERRVAIKRMREEIRDDPVERERFLKEARIVAKLRHSYIVEIYAIVEHEGEVFLVFEFLHGQTLDEVLAKKGRIDILRARPLLKRVCSGLEYAHEQGVIHRDLKPSNIMLTKERRVKVTDFGVAAVVKDALNRLSRTDGVVGTPPYMAPEAEAGKVSIESDLYSLAVTLYQMLTGERPFMGAGAGMLMQKMEMRFAPPSTKVPGLSPAVDAFFTSALHADPEKRPRSAGAFLMAFEAALAPPA